MNNFTIKVSNPGENRLYSNIRTSVSYEANKTESDEMMRSGHRNWAVLRVIASHSIAF